MKTTVPVRRYPTPEQAAMLHAHCREYLSTVNVLVAALDSAVLPDGGQDASTKDFTATLPSAVKNQALRDARSVWNRSFDLGVIPVLRTPICQGNNQHGRVDGKTLLLPVCQDGQVERVGQIAIRASGPEPLGKPGVLRLTRTRGKWVADVTSTLPEPEPTRATGIMGVDLGVDLGVQVPAVGQVLGKGNRFGGTGRAPRAQCRQCSARRKNLQKAKQVRAVRKSQGQARRWMREVNHQLSPALVSPAQPQQGGVIRLERLAGIRQRTVRHAARTSGGAAGRKAAKARKNNRLIATWTCYQLAAFIADKAARAGSAVEWVDPAYTRQTCPACCRLNSAADQRG